MQARASHKHADVLKQGRIIQILIRISIHKGRA
jgi:hypothetical protein